MRQVTFSSGIRNSWHRKPIDGIGRDQGKNSNSPDCKRLKRYPASILVFEDMGGVLISPCNHTNGLSVTRTIVQYISNPTYLTTKSNPFLMYFAVLKNFFQVIVDGMSRDVIEHPHHLLGKPDILIGINRIDAHQCLWPR
jgi:hypothetical protein